MTKPLLSVTVLNYNYGHYLSGCLESILDQTFADFEVVLIDDCSTDNSLEVIRPFLADPRVKLVAHKENQGFRKSLIEGTEVHSTGDFLTVISADDLVMDRDAFRRQIEMLTSDDEVVLCFSSVCDIYEEAVVRTHHSLPRDMRLSPQECLDHLLLDKHFWVLHSGAMFRKAAYVAAGGYRRDIEMIMDYALWFPLCLEGDTGYIHEALYGYRMHSGQMSSKKMRLNAREEVLLINDACRAGEARGLRSLRHRRGAIRNRLSSGLVRDAFSGDRAKALSRLLAYVSVSPVEMLTSRETWLSLIRVALGEKGFDLMRRRLPLGSSRAVNSAGARA